MSETTPGPWTYGALPDKPLGRYLVYAIDDSGDERIDVATCSAESAELAEANALLIMVAPEMFELLEKLVRGQEVAGLKSQAEALINRAHGLPPQ